MPTILPPVWLLESKMHGGPAGFSKSRDFFRFHPINYANFEAKHLFPSFFGGSMMMFWLIIVWFLLQTMFQLQGPSSSPVASSPSSLASGAVLPGSAYLIRFLPPAFSCLSSCWLAMRITSSPLWITTFPTKIVFFLPLWRKLPPSKAIALT